MRNYSLLGLLLFTYSSSALDAPPVDTNSMLTNLKKIQQNHTASTTALYNNTIRDFFNAAANGGNAMAFYEQAIQATQFEGQNREHSQFQDWKKKEADKLKSREMQEAVRLQLNYLGLSMQRATGMDVKDLLQALANHADQVFAEQDLLGGQDLVRQNMTSSVFAKWYQIEGLLSGLKEWEFSAGNAEAIYQKTILPKWREQKDPRLLQYWDARLDRENGKAGNARQAFQSNTFELVQKPKLLWSRAQDLLLLGQRNRALTEMFAVIKSYPAHPDFDQWSTKLEDLLSNRAVEAPAASTAN